MAFRGIVVSKSVNGRRRRHHFRRRTAVSYSYGANGSRTWDDFSTGSRAAIERLSRMRRGLPEPLRTSGPIKRPVGSPKIGTIIHAPEYLSLSSAHRDAFLGFLYCYRWEAHVQHDLTPHKGRAYLIELSGVRQLDIDAALVLVAEYYRDIRATNYRPLIDDEAWDPDVRNLMQQLGFYDFVSAAARSHQELETVVDSNIQFVKFETGKKVVSDQATGLIERIGKVAGNAPESDSVYSGLVEAMMNVNEHAYAMEETQVYKSIPNWWIAGSYDASNQVLQFVAYDQGVGIPSTIREKPNFVSFLKGIIKGNEDADWIEAAIELGRTSTDMPERGNGLWTICQVVEELAGSSVRILSGHGEVTYSSRGALQKKTYDNPFCGTLVEWTLKMPSTDERPDVAEI